MSQLDGPEKFVFLQELKSLRTFLPLSFSNPSQCSDSSKMVSDLCLPILKNLRVLSFSCQAINKLPDFLGQLIHLRYLDLSQTFITKFPEWTCSLYNLQTLLLSSCHNLTELPAKIGNLINLRILNVSETNKRRCYLDLKD
jgi:Leucine-rich repeat (LRR) protein